ncbi:FAM194 protein [Mactra antiquata]
MEEQVDKSKTTARSVDFSTSKPLPPISGPQDEDQRVPSAGSNVSSRRSIDSSAALDRPGEGSARPRIIRGFRPEVMSDDEYDDDTQKFVSFNGAPTKSKRKTYDGREVTFVTLDTQTDWDWVEQAETSGTAKTLSLDEKAGSFVGKEKTIQSPKSGSSKPETGEEKTPADISSFQMPYNDEYGIPILDLSSDTDDSSDDESSHRKMKDDRTFLPSVGPPNILQYQRESEKQDIIVNEPEVRLEGSEYDKDETGMTHGMFSGNCEFCKQMIKPFPTVDQQLRFAPEVLYCCNEYREFVEFVLSTTNDMEEEQKKKNKLIDIKPHEHVGSKQERNAAKEKAVQRMRERELQRRQQEASGMQQNFFASSGQQGQGQGSLPKGYLKMAGMSSQGGPTMKDMFDTSTLNMSEIQEVIVETKCMLIARQMKTINYQLSSQKCLEEGWTLRPPSPLLDEDGDDVFIPEPLNPELMDEAKLRERPLIEKFYEHGQKFLTMFPDGTGNVFYPSGNLAILISSVKLGQYYYTIHHDYKRSSVAAAFEPNGYGYCYFPNGDIRLYLDQYGGIELDNYGSRRRKWTWKDQVVHVHAPPFQPICIGLNKNMGVRVMSQENIALTFSANKRSCRFNMGSRLKLVAPENAPLKEIEEDYIFLEEKKNMVDSLLNKVANLLKFPNNPKLDKMLPPLHVTSKQNKTEKLKKDRQIYLAQQSAREKKQSSITVT